MIALYNKFIAHRDNLKMFFISKQHVIFYIILKPYLSNRYPQG